MKKPLDEVRQTYLQEMEVEQGYILDFHKILAEDARPLSALLQIMRFLWQEVPNELAEGSVEDFWDWSVLNWDAARVPGVPGVIV